MSGSEFADRDSMAFLIMFFLSGEICFSVWIKGSVILPSERSSPMFFPICSDDAV